MVAKKQPTRQDIIRSMQHVLSLPSGSAERWRAAFKHFLLQRPEAKVEIDHLTAYCKEMRQNIDKFGSTKNGRQTMATPTFLLPLLRQTDPEYFMSQKSADMVSLRHLKLMKKAFPEFFLPEIL